MSSLKKNLSLRETHKLQETETLRVNFEIDEDSSNRLLLQKRMTFNSITSRSDIDHSKRTYWEFIKHRMMKKQSKKKLCYQLEHDSELKRCLNFFDLMCYGLGANIGSNFFLFIGELLLIAGPSICISFFIGGVISMITAMCFAELASRIPTNGGQYSYVYIYYGECLGWIAFVLMSFEYGLSSALNAVGFMTTVKVTLKEVGLSLPDYIFTTNIYEDVISINPMATVLVFILIMIMLKGIKESIQVNNFFTVGILCFYQYANVLSIVIFDQNRATPFFRNGMHGVMKGAAVAFFGYTSFEQPITVAEEALFPQRDLPRSLTRQIIVETIQYSALAYLVSGFIDIESVNPESQNTMIPNALMGKGYLFHSYVILIGTLIGMLPTVLDSLLSQTRILYRVSKDKMISGHFMRVNPKTQVPQFSVLCTGGVIMIIVLLFDISFLAQFISISTLVGYCLIMSIVVFKKMARKQISAILQLGLFASSLIFGFFHSLGDSASLIIMLLSICIVLIIMILIEAKLYPDKDSMEEDRKEAESFADKPYTCILNPFVPCIGIWGSGVIIGYIDIIVWTTFFGILVLIAVSYFVFVIPKKYIDKTKKRNLSRAGSINIRMGSINDNRRLSCNQGPLNQ